MSRIHSFQHDNGNVELLPPCDFAQENTYTVIVGKNGVGKSRLLANICKKSADGHYDYHFKYQALPLVIAASTSPFDKFPAPKRRKHHDDSYSLYRYVGMRGEGMFSSTSAISLISSASRALLEKTLNGRNNTDLLGVFDSLSFSASANFIFKPAFSRNLENDLTHSKREKFIVRGEVDEDVFELDDRYSIIFREANSSLVEELIYAMGALGKYFDFRKAISLNVDFKSNFVSLEGQNTEPRIINSIILLMNHNLLRLMDVHLEKRDHGELSLRRASSGEQCLIVLMLGIAGHIEDGSLILIDEPEISLHPRWQEEFMPLLMASFKNYKNCQFIIATHSPQIVAKMKGGACFVCSLSTNKLYSAEEFNDKSADYQLAELFDAPGMMNEYISRISFSLIAKLRKREKIDSETKSELAKLIELQSKLSPEDPTKTLIDSVEELYNSYASNK